MSCSLGLERVSRGSDDILQMRVCFNFDLRDLLARVSLWFLIGEHRGSFCVKSCLLSWSLQSTAATQRFLMNVLKTACISLGYHSLNM